MLHSCGPARPSGRPHGQAGSAPAMLVHDTSPCHTVGHKFQIWAILPTLIQCHETERKCCHQAACRRARPCGPGSKMTVSAACGGSVGGTLASLVHLPGPVKVLVTPLAILGPCSRVTVAIAPGTMWGMVSWPESPSGPKTKAMALAP